MGILQDLKLPSSHTKRVEGNQTSQSGGAEPQPSGPVDKTAVSYTDNVFVYCLFVYRQVQKSLGQIQEDEDITSHDI